MRFLLMTCVTAVCLSLPLNADETATAKKSETTNKKETAAAKRTLKPVIPVLKISGAISEKPTAEDNPFNFAGAGGESLHSLLQRLDKAKSDESVPAVVLKVEAVMLGRAQLEEVGRALRAFRDAGKTIHVHCDTLSTGEYALLSSASEVSMVPTGYLFITGMYGEQLFIRGLLDKLGVTPDYFTCGDFKSAAEMFMRTEPSEQSAAMSKWLYDGLYDGLLNTIAAGRRVSVEKAGEWIDTGVFTADEALAAGIVDAVEHHHDFEERLRKAYGDEFKFDHNYGRKSGNQIDLSSPFGLMNFYAELLAPSTPRRSTKPGVAIVYLEGSIMDGSGGGNPFIAQAAAFSHVVRKALDEAAEDDAIKAVVFRIDSPGGSAVASEVILNAAKRVAAKKPLVVSMGNVAASGGYYVACGTDTIVAESSTVTGSIGVVSGKFATTKLWNKLGITFTPIQRGRNAALLSSARVFSDSERAALQSYMDATYDVFKGHVQNARGEKLQKPLDDIAGGRVYTGGQALELGLVDKIGGLHDAIAMAAQKADLKAGYDVRVVPRPKNFMELLMDDLSGSGKDSGHLSLTGRLSTTHDTLLQTLLPMLQGVDPVRADQVRHALLQLLVLQNEGVSLSMPPVPKAR
ncbi:MAG: signal peptide peptidase SppA [Planctomycetaceae bacterium]